MGAVNFVVSEKGRTAREAFNIAVEKAEEMYGSDQYNGTISTTDLGEGVACIRDYDPNLDKQLVVDFLEKVFREDCEEPYKAEKWVSKYVELIPKNCKSTDDKGYVFYGWSAT